METIEGDVKSQPVDKKPKSKIKIDISFIRWVIGMTIAFLSISPIVNEVNWVRWLAGIVLATCINGTIRIKNIKIKF